MNTQAAIDAAQAAFHAGFGFGVFAGAAGIYLVALGYRAWQERQQ